ncbi:ABC transporter permease [Amycolatopsis sp. GM8]|uniref:ABC transporter permease n=1 Tax=Amycolatopsis sp. GM8 TaxID=2896530 RepID=UPI001F273922|nr:ABC transporter permease [Amycolatopsis sp. GM8]
MTQTRDPSGTVRNDGLPQDSASPEEHDAAKAEPRRRRPAALVYGERFGLVGLLVVVAAVFSLLRPATFFTLSNLQTIVTTQSVSIVAALALMLPLIAGRFDVSIGSNISICSVAGAAAMSEYSSSLVVAVLVALAVGALVGTFNGVVVSYFGVSSLIGTLGTSTVLVGVIQAYTHGTPISNNLPSSLTNLGNMLVAGVPAMFVLALIISVLAWYLLTQTPYGKRLTAVGSNLRAAELTGIPTRRTVALSFVGAGVLSGAAGVMQIGVQGSADPQIGGINFILPAVAAVFLGSTTWRPGRFNVAGTILALLFVATAVSGLALVGAAPWITDVFQGGAIIVAIALSAQFRKRRTGVIEMGA